MRTGFRAPLSTAIAISFGLIILLSLFVTELTDLRNRILNWAILLAALALLLGLANLFQVHFRKMREKEKYLYSFVLIVGMVVTFAATLVFGSQTTIPSWIFNYVQVPIETSLMAVLAVSLTLSAARLVRNRTDLMTIVFLVTLFILLVGSGPLFGLELPYLTRVLAPYINNSLAVGAMRGLLIGVALGTVTTGLRVLIGADRPYGG
jgi:hypothetical protein